MCSRLSLLHSSARPHPSRLSVVAVDAAFGSGSVTLDDSEPIGSGCIAQVHLGRLSDGTKVAVKVLHPGVRWSIAADLDVMRFGVAALETIPYIKWLSLGGSVEEFGGILQQQLDVISLSSSRVPSPGPLADADSLPFMYP